MMKDFYHKGRKRESRGKNSSLSDLPEYKQNIFKTIKINIEEYYGCEMDVYFFGSHRNGNWDDLSDYDIMLSDSFTDLNLKNYLQERLEIKVDIFFTSNFEIGILI